MEGLVKCLMRCHPSRHVAAECTESGRKLGENVVFGAHCTREALTGYLRGHVAAKCGTAYNKARALRDSSADLIK